MRHKRQTFQYNVAVFSIEPSTTAHMQQHLVLALWKVVELTSFRKAIGLQIMPYLLAQISLVKINVKDADDGTGFILLVSHFFFDFFNLEVIQNAGG